MRIINKAALVAAALAPLAMLGTPANAAGAGAAAFQGDVTLPAFPCSGSGCNATFNSTLAVGVGVSTSTGTLVVDTLSATVNYSETCAGGQAVSGSATGTATLSGVGTSVSVPFAWLRVGLVAVVTSNPATNTAPAVVGAAVFVPQGGLPTCTGGSVTATVAGVAALVTTA